MDNGKATNTTQLDTDACSFVVYRLSFRQSCSRFLLLYSFLVTEVPEVFLSFVDLSTNDGTKLHLLGFIFTIHYPLAYHCTMERLASLML